MSIFGWLSSKRVERHAETPESSGLGYVDPTVPADPWDRLRSKSVPPSVNHVANRKTERLERRELVYGVVRDSMTRAGVLASSFKFKVLSLDVSGYQYLIMVDLGHQAAGDAARLAEIEAMVAQAAKSRHNILVTAVYWRVNEYVTAGLSPVQSKPIDESGHVTPIELRKSAMENQFSTSPSAPLTSGRQEPKYQPLQADEVAAFKRALVNALPATPLSAPGQITKSGPRNPSRARDFEDTQIVPAKGSHSPLSVTQYGDLI